MDDLLASNYITCRYCLARVNARQLREHEDECRQRAHDTQERFE